MRKPRIFVASSVESLDVADAINVNLDHQAEVTLWKNGFRLSTDSIDSLIEKARTVDFAVFVFTPDDVAQIRERKEAVVRDNVVFELGLFISSIGKQRCFIVKPRNVDLHLPTDLLGLSPADYEGNRSDGDLTSAVNHPCVLIKKEVAKLGLISPDLEVQKSGRKKLGYDYQLGEVEHQLLAKVLEDYADSLNGVSVSNTFSAMKGFGNGVLGLASIKLERLGYLERSIQTDYNDNQYYAFSIMADGIDYLLENESKIFGVKLRNADDVGDFAEDIPF